MNADNREKLAAWLKRPRSSFGFLATVGSLVLLLSVVTWFEPAFDRLMAHPWIVLLLVISSMAIGVMVQHRYTLLVGKSIFSPAQTNWKKKLGLTKTYAKESNIALCILLLLGTGYPLTLFFAARSTEAIVSACKSNLDARLQASGESDEAPSISLPVCQCLSKVFLDRNGILRLALFKTELLDAADYEGVSEADEAFCIDSVFESASDLALRSTFPTMHVLPRQSGQ
ncbi:MULTISPECIES: hypothetical protein [unclassified Pseudomonas]|uniref:hypothetical protein n=1 Tax=unclassified Pseudomonas TaxID=196821 RepID=UPI000BA4936D|nr:MULTISPECIES: hypothetical protein [unclassified Pseudomonas]